MKISVLGWYGHRNVGDEAYKIALPRLFPAHDLTFGNKPAAGDNCDAIILGGGDVVHNDFTRHFARFPDIPKIALSVTLTDGSDFSGAEQCDHVYVRDLRSLDVGMRMLGQGRVSYLPDATFLLTPDPAAGHEWVNAAFESEGHHVYQHIVVVVVSAYTSFSGQESLARDFITSHANGLGMAKTFDDMNASFIFIPFCTETPNDDRPPNGLLASRCKYHRKNLVVYESLGSQQVLDIVACADAVVSTRLHATIFATIAGVPFVDLTHHDKNLGFVEGIGMTSRSIPWWQFTGSRFRDLLAGCVDAGRLPDPGLQLSTTLARMQLAQSSASLFPTR